MYSTEDIVERDSLVIFTELDDELLIVDVESGKYVSINQYGCAIWRLLAKPTKIDALIVQLEDEYYAPRDQIFSDLMGFLEDLDRRGLVRVIPA